MIKPPNEKIITKRFIPHKPCLCVYNSCVYNSSEGICNNPYCNHGNGDADCHKLSPRKLLTCLTKIT